MKEQKISDITPQVYARLFELLDLSPNHKAQLTARGMSAELIAKVNYRSLTASRSAIVVTLSKEFDLKGVPGFWLPDDKGKNARWQLAGANGMLIPICDHTGGIVQIKIKVDKPIGAAKYLSLSSKNNPNGTAAVASTHMPIFNHSTEIIRITEGEIKADIATHLSGVYTVSCPGVSSWRKTADLVLSLNPERILVCFDSDKDSAKHIYSGKELASTETDKPNDVGIYAGKLTRYLDSAHPDVQIETWTEEQGKGIDDVLADGHTPSIMSQEEKAVFIQEKLAGIVQFGWFYAGMTGMMHNYNDPARPVHMKRENWNLLYANEDNTKPFEAFILDPASLKFEDITYIPKGDQIVNLGHSKQFNSWSPIDLDPVEGDVTPLLNHIRALLPDEEESRIVERFFAWMVGREGQKLAWVVLIQGQQGIGKTWFAELLQRCLGAWNVSMPDNAEIISDYTAWAKEKSTIVIDEFDAGAAMNKRKVMDKLKPMITGNTVRIREMFRNFYPMPNCFNILAFTNHKDAAYVEEGDRRYFYVEAQDPRRIDPDHLKKLWDWLREPETPAKVLHWAQTYDHSWLEENGQQSAPMTKAKERLTSENMHPVDQWVTEGIYTHEHPFNRDVICTSFLMRFVPFWVKGANVTNLGRALNKHPTARKEPREIPFGSGRGKKRSVYYLRSPEKYVDLKPKEISALLTGDEPMLESESMEEYTDRLISNLASEKPNNPHNDDKPI